MKQVQEVVMFKIDKSDATSLAVVKEVYYMIKSGDLRSVLVDANESTSIVESIPQTDLIENLNDSITFCVRMTASKEKYMKAVIRFITRMITRRLKAVSLDIEYTVSDFIITDYDDVIQNEGE